MTAELRTTIYTFPDGQPFKNMVMNNLVIHQEEHRVYRSATLEAPNESGLIVAR
jgi:hypothetical protein